MAADQQQPAVGTPVLTDVPNIRDTINYAIGGRQTDTLNNPLTGARRYHAVDKVWQEFNGSTWVDLVFNELATDSEGILISGGGALKLGDFTGLSSLSDRRLVVSADADSQYLLEIRSRTAGDDHNQFLHVFKGTTGENNIFFNVEQPSTGDSIFTISAASKRVGINIASPTYALDVGGAARCSDQFIVANGSQGRFTASPTQVTVANDSNVPTVFSQNGLERIRLASDGNFLRGFQTSLSPSMAAQIQGLTYIGAGTGTNTEGVAISPNNGGTHNLYSNSTGTGAARALSAGVFAHRTDQVFMALDGKVGIKNSDPRQSFHVTGDAVAFTSGAYNTTGDTDIYLAGGFFDNGQPSGVLLRNTQFAGGGTQFQILEALKGVTAYGDYTAGAVRFHIGSNGNVGIGNITNPNQKLDIEGSIAVGGSSNQGINFHSVSTGKTSANRRAFLAFNSSNATFNLYQYNASGVFQNTAITIDEGGVFGVRSNLSSKTFGSAFRHIRLGEDNGLMAGTNDIMLTQNAYYDGTNWKAINTANTSQLNTNINGMFYSTSTGDTAGSNVTFSDQFVVENSGKVHIGAINPALTLGASYKHMRFGDKNGWMSNNTTIWTTQNSYFDGSNWRVVDAANASVLTQDGSAIVYSTSSGAAAGGLANFVEAFRIMNNGAVGINVPSPAERLHVGGNAIINGSAAFGGGALVDSRVVVRDAGYIQSWVGSGDADNRHIAIYQQDSTFRFIFKNDNDTYKTDAMTLHSNGRVAFGSTVATAHKVLIQSGAGENQALRLVTNQNGVADFCEMKIDNADNDSIIVGSIGRNYANTDWANSSYIYTTNATRDFYIKSAKDLVFFAGGTALADRAMTIKDGGNVGVGTTDPLVPLQVNDYGGLDGNANELMIRNNLYFNSGIRAIKTGFSSQINMRNLEGKIEFKTGPSVAAGAPVTLDTRMTILNNGDVGIGTGSPAYKLDVSGWGRFTGTLFADSFAVTEGGTHEYSMAYFNGGLNFAEAGVADYRLFIKDGGFVGVGTNNPTSKFHVVGNIRAEGSIIGNTAGLFPGGTEVLGMTTGAGQHFRVLNDGLAVFGDSGLAYTLRVRGSGSTAPQFQLENNQSGGKTWALVAGQTTTDDITIRNVTNGYNDLRIQDGVTQLRRDNIGGLNFNPNYAKANSHAAIETADSSYALAFYTNGARRMSITSGGNIGIGTTTPLVQLTTANSAINSSTASNTVAGLNIVNKQASYTANNIVGQIGFTIQDGYANGPRANMFGYYEATDTLGNESDVGMGIRFATSQQGDTSNTVRVAIAPDGRIDLTGAEQVTHFFQGTNQHTHIRPGKSIGKVFIADLTSDSVHVNGSSTLTAGASDNKFQVHSDINMSGDLYKNGTLVNLGGSSLWTENGADIWRQTGDVGIRIAAPLDRFHVHTAAASQTATRYTNTITGSTTPSSHGFVTGISGSGNAMCWNHSNTNLDFATNNTGRVSIKSGGNINVGDFLSTAHSLMHLHKASATTVQIRLTNSNSGSTASDGAYFAIDASSVAYLWNNESSDLVFGAHNGEKARMNSEALQVTKKLNLAAAGTVLTMSSGAVTVSKSYHKVTTSGGASEDLANINGGTEGDIIHITKNASGQTPTLTNNGNIRTSTGADVIMQFEVVYSFIYDGTNWLALV